MAKIIYDGEGAVFGRLASLAAKDLLKGNEVEILNCEKIVVSGDKKLLADKILAKREMGSGGSLKGPKYPRIADKLVKRMIRGMLPRDTAKGREAYKRLKCFESESGERKAASGEEIIKLNHRMPARHASISEIVRLLK